MADIVKKLAPLFQSKNGQLVQVMPETYAAQVTVNPGTADAATAEAMLNELKTNLGNLQTTVSNFLTGTADDPVGTLDKLSELVAAIDANKDSISAIVDGYVKTEDIVDGLESTSAVVPLSANQGRVLDGKISAAQAAANKKQVAYVELEPDDEGFEEAIAALNLADGAFVTVIK